MKWLAMAVWMVSGGVAYADDDEEPGGTAPIGGPVAGVAGRTGTASGPIPKWRFSYAALLGARTNPLGLSLDFRPALQRRIYKSTSTIGRSNFTDIAPTFNISPAYVRGGLSARVQPAAIIRLGARVERIFYMGSFDQLQSWPTADAAAEAGWDDLTQDENGEAGLNYSTGGWFAAGEILLRAKVKNIAILNQTRLIYADVDLQDGDNVFYEITYDALLANQGVAAINDLSTVWVPESIPLTAGLRWSVIQARHPDESDAIAADALQRLGPLVSWKFSGTEGKGVSNLSAFTIVQWWLQHPYRTGQVSSQAVPYFILGVSMQGDFIQWKTQTQ